MTPWGKIHGSLTGLPATSGTDGQFRQCVRPRHWREFRYSESERFLYATRPSLQGYITTREELTEASNELFSLIASGVIKVDVAENQRYALKDARRAHEVLKAGPQGSSLLIP